MTRAWSFRPARPDDEAALAALRGDVLNEDLRRHGLFEPARIRHYFAERYRPENTRIILLDGREVGSIAVRHEADGSWLEHFYLHPDAQGRGIGSDVLRHVLAEPHPAPMRLVALVGSRARALYERHGFVHIGGDAIEDLLERPGAPRTQKADGRTGHQPAPPVGVQRERRV